MSNFPTANSRHVERLVPARFLFHFAIPCRLCHALASSAPVRLDETFRLPSFEALDERPSFADVRAAWNETGLGFSLRVERKRLPARCLRDRPTECDGFQVWIDTRATHTIHRASRFCHQFVFLPTGGGARRDAAWAQQLWINRARENARRADPREIVVRGERRVDGYWLDAFLSAAALTGYDPGEHPRLGFIYLVRDEELGEQTFTASPEFAFDDDPSLWATLELEAAAP